MEFVQAKVEEHTLVITILASILDNDVEVRQVGSELLQVLSEEPLGRVLLDFGKVEFMSAAMIGQLYVVYSKCRSLGIDLKAGNVSTTMCDLFNDVQLEDFVGVFSDVNAAKASFGQSAIETKYWDFGLRTDQVRAAAEEGNPIAQYELAKCYELGRGLPHNPTQAFAWFQKASASGNADAQHRLAVGYAYGIATDQNYDEALRWHRAAAAQGQVNSQYAMGMSYHFGIGVEENVGEAKKYYQMAAAQGHRRAIEQLDQLSLA